jgi:hypothetical protein
MRADVHFLTLQTGDRDIRSGTVLWTSSSALTPDVWNYIEIKVTIGDSANYIVRVNGVEWVNTTGDTKPASATDITQITFGNTTNVGSSGNRRYYDDIWIADDAFQGDCRVETLMPESEGTYEQFLNPDSTPNYSVVDEVTPNTADYVYANLAGSTDSYGFPALDEIAGNIKGVAVNTYVQKDSSGTKTIGGFARVGGDEEVSAGQTVPSSWGFVQQFIDNPADSDGNWNVVDVNAAEFGQQVIS